MSIKNNLKNGYRHGYHAKLKRDIRIGIFESSTGVNKAKGYLSSRLKKHISIQSRLMKINNLWQLSKGQIISRLVSVIIIDAMLYQLSCDKRINYRMHGMLGVINRHNYQLCSMDLIDKGISIINKVGESDPKYLEVIALSTVGILMDVILNPMFEPELKNADLYGEDTLDLFEKSATDFVIGLSSLKSIFVDNNV